MTSATSRPDGEICPECGKLVPPPESRVGRQMLCPHCAAVIVMKEAVAAGKYSFPCMILAKDAPATRVNPIMGPVSAIPILVLMNPSLPNAPRNGAVTIGEERIGLFAGMTSGHLADTTSKYETDEDFLVSKVTARIRRVDCRLTRVGPGIGAVLLRLLLYGILAGVLMGGGFFLMTGDVAALVIGLCGGVACGAGLAGLLLLPMYFIKFGRRRELFTLHADDGDILRFAVSQDVRQDVIHALQDVGVSCASGGLTAL